MDPIVNAELEVRSPTSVDLVRVDLDLVLDEDALATLDVIE